MRTLVLSVVLLSVFCSALGQLSAGINWQGTWSNGKLGGGSLYICTDEATRTAHGSYGNLGLISGYLLGNSFTGYWYEAGYDRPFGPFELTINQAGNSFTGSWSYFVDDGVVANTSFTWSGSKSSGARPNEDTQCLFPAQQSTVQGVFDQRNYICDHSTIDWLDSRQSMWSASFDGFGKVQGYSPDHGNSLLLSDFYYPDDEDDRSRFRPESFSIGQPWIDRSQSSGADDDDSIFTSHIVVGRFVSQDRFCGWFWYGFYTTVVNSVPICFSRTHNVAVDPQACAFTLPDVKQQIHQYDDGNTSQLIKNIQDAFDALTLPEFIIDIVQGNNDGSGPPANGKDVNGLQYIEQYIAVCNSASGLLVSIAALFVIFLAL